MSLNLGNLKENATASFGWDTGDVDGASITRATDGTVTVWKDGDSTAASTTGVTDNEDEGGNTGLHTCVIDTSDAFYTTGHDYQVVLLGAVIDGRTVNAALAEFSIENRFAEVDLTHILGHLLTQTGTQLADGFEHFFDAATPAITVADAMVGTDNALTTKTGFTLTNLSDANAAKLEDMLDGTGAVLTLSQLVVDSAAAGGAVDIDNSGGPGVSINGTNYGLRCIASAESSFGARFESSGWDGVGLQVHSSHADTGTGFQAAGPDNDIVADISGTISAATAVTNRVEADMTYLHGTALTETAGQLAGRFVDFFDQDSVGYNVKTPLSDFKATGYFVVGDYTAPDNTGIADAKTASEAVDTLTKAGGDGDLAVLVGKFTGITLLAKWLRGLFRKDEMDATAKTEVNLGDGVYDEATDSNEALRDWGDTAWITGSDPGLNAQGVRDAMKLAPTVGDPAAGSVDKHLDDIQAKTNSLGTGRVTVTSPVATDAAVSFYQYDDYDDDESRAFEWTNSDGNWGSNDITGATVAFRARHKTTGDTVEVAGVVVDATGTQKVRVELTSVQSGQFVAGQLYDYQVRLTLGNGRKETIVSSSAVIVASIWES